MSFLDFIMGTLPDEKHWLDYYDRCGADTFSLFSRQEQEKTLDLLVGGILVKVHLLAIKDDKSEYGTITCKVTEIDGVSVSAKEQEEKMQVMPLYAAPTPQQQMTILSDALEQFGLKGQPIPVSDEYVRGHLRVLRIRNKLAGGGR